MASPQSLTLTPQGLYCPDGDFYIDPWRSVECALVTHAHSDHARAGSARYFSAQPSVPLLEERLSTSAPIQGTPYGEKIKFKNAWVSFHPAGHILGSAQIRVETSKEVCVVSGDYKRDPDPTCSAFEVVPCDTFITEATFGLPHYSWDPTPKVAREILNWWEANRKRGLNSILYCYSLGKAQRILAEIGKFTNDRILLHGAAAKLTQIYRDAGVTLPPTEEVKDAKKKQSFSGELILAPPGAGQGGWIEQFKEYRTAFASGWMAVRGAKRWRGYDRGFVVSDHADWPSLIRTVEETGARNIFATHGSSEILSRYLKEKGLNANVLRTEYGGKDAE